MSDAIVRKFADLDRILETCSEDSPEEKVAEFLISIGLIERYNGSFRLTEAGKKFLKLPVEK